MAAKSRGNKFSCSAIWRLFVLRCRGYEPTGQEIRDLFELLHLKVTIPKEGVLQVTGWFDTMPIEGTSQLQFNHGKLSKSLS